MKVSIIIPTRNRSADLRRCLQALAAQDFPREQFEVIVCDDGSDEEIASVVRPMMAAGLRVRCERQAPAGPAAARNLGILHATGEIVAMTDSDTLPEPRWLSKLCEALDADPEAVGVEGMVYAENEGEFDPLGEGPTNKSGGVFLTCNCAYRRSALLQVGGFDEGFPFPAYEDTDLAASAGRLGRILWQPEARVMHPQRPLTLRAVIRKLHHWEYVLLMGYRYGYLAWKRYPVRHPRLRVAALSVIALPLAKFKTAAEWFGRKPAEALKLAGFGLVESLGALVLVAPKALFGRHERRLARRSRLSASQ
ncbi:MAG: glycosyltransferase family A protein [Blastocatellia bacterium]|nr:glycosyltransferase family A protein [Blastocatellia bacterium]